jgi:hypothetical protein
VRSQRCLGGCDLTTKKCCSKFGCKLEGVREGIERLLPDERFGASRHVGAFWTRTNSIEVDLVGGDTLPSAKNIGFVGSVKWREDHAFDRADGAALAAKRLSVPGANTSTKLIAVSRRGFAPRGVLDVELEPKDIISAYRERDAA